jgi:uncharacterized RDD family membrane protein YckC
VKCPKCGYLGFESVERCRNCGYEFSLTAPATPDLPLPKHTDDAPDPLDDLNLGRQAAAVVAPSGADLPLFSPEAAADEPLITKASPPRQPLAVRRATPELQRSWNEPKAQSFDLAFDGEPASRASALRRRASEPATKPAADPRTIDAPLWARLGAVLLDVIVLALVDTAVVYFTAEICGIAFNDAGALPRVPLIAFLLVQNVGYLIIFTAGGQTLGKMAFGIRVVAADEAEPLDLGRAARRTVLWLAMAIPAGLGFVSTLFSHDRRGLHDRLAGTRVVRASA